MNNFVKKIIIVGGGTAGWLTAGILAAEYKNNPASGIQITLVESPDVSIVGVGDGAIDAYDIEKNRHFRSGFNYTMLRVF